MPIAQNTIVVDGQTYKPGDTIPELGSLHCTKVEGNVRHYAGLTKDVNLLPKYKNLATGSTFEAVDSSLYMMYEATTKTWYEKSSGGDTPEQTFQQLWAQDLPSQVDPNYLLDFNEGGDWK